MMQIKMSKGTMFIGRVQETSFQLSSTSKVTWTQFNSPSNGRWQHIQTIANQGSSLNLVSRDFTRGQSLQKSNQYSMAQAPVKQVVAFTISHILKLYRVAQLPKYTGLLSRRIYQETRPVLSIEFADLNMESLLS